MEKDYVYEIADHLLPGDWRVELEPTCGKPNDDVVLEAIKKLYPKPITTPERKWRNKRSHRKCIFCRNFESYPIDIHLDEEGWCRPKMKNVSRDIHRYFCSLFELR